MSVLEFGYSIGGSPLWVMAVESLLRGDNERAVNAIIKENALIELRSRYYLCEAVRYDHPQIRGFVEAQSQLAGIDLQLVNEVAQDMYFGFYKTALQKLGVEVKEDTNENS